MKIRMTLKDPDGVYDALTDAVRESIGEIQPPLSLEEQTLLLDRRREELYDAIRGWVECGEYVNIEIDTDSDTAEVLPPCG